MFTPFNTSRLQGFFDFWEDPAEDIYGEFDVSEMLVDLDDESPLTPVRDADREVLEEMEA